MVSWKRRAVRTAALASLAGTVWLLRERAAPRPHHRLILSDEPFELRAYPPQLVAAISHAGARHTVLKRAYSRLSRYLDGRDRVSSERRSARLPMMVPVLHSRDGEGGWRTCVLMPEGWGRENLPSPLAGITLEAIPPRTVAVVPFRGSPDERGMRRHEDSLRRWMEERGLRPIGVAEHACYNSPTVPPPLRHNEVWVQVAPG